MNLDQKHILSVLGWCEGVKIPTANAENRELESQVAQLIKRKSDAMIKLCMMNENVKFVKNSLQMLNHQRDYNQELINGLSKQLDTEMNSMKDVELSQIQRVNDVKHMKKGLKEIESNIETTKNKIQEMTIKLMELKESLCWGEDALLEWGASVARGERELQVLEKYRQQEQEKFQVLDREKKLVDQELIDAQELERREEERFKMLSLQLENVYKLTKESAKEQERLMAVWQESVETCNLREEEGKRLSFILCEVNNQAREKCSELYEEEKFYEEMKNTNESINAEIKKYKEEAIKQKGETAEEEKIMKYFQVEAELRKKSAGNISHLIEVERAKQIKIDAKNKVKRCQLDEHIEMVDCLKQELNAMMMDFQVTDTTYRKAEEIYQMKKKQVIEEGKEIDRLNQSALELQREIASIQNNTTLKKKEIDVKKKCLREMDIEYAQKEDELQSLEQALFFLAEEERVLVKKIVDLRDKCSGGIKEEREELENEIKQLEEEEAIVLKEHLLLRKRLECLQREYRDKLRNLKNCEEELKKLKDKNSSTKITYLKCRKDIEKLREEQHKANTQLKLMKMREFCLKENIMKDDSAVGRLEQARSLLERAMKDRIMEVEANKDVLVGKKKSLLEEKLMRMRQIDHLKTQLNLHQSRYAATLDLLGKDDSGQQLSVAYFKIKLAQEKYELQLECEELEAKIQKAESEINAMENTLKWFKATNENFKFSMDRMDENDDTDARGSSTHQMQQKSSSGAWSESHLFRDAIKIEKEQAETKYADLSNTIEEDSIALKSFKKDLEGLLADILFLKDKENELKEVLRVKTYEIREIEKDICSKNLRFERATKILRKLLNDVKKLDEPLKYKALAQKEINIKLEEDRNQSALQQLTNLSSKYEEIKDILEKQCEQSPFRVLRKPSNSRYSEIFKTRNRLNNAKSRSISSRGSMASRDSTASSQSSTVSVINLDPSQLFSNISTPPCLKKKH